ncbi:MAG: PIG-L family deacetylase [Syntrophomonadaceae bacterium]|nr:PIG-L family deacetylase [Syntrophomonadaceae bacterium]
MKQRVLVFSPHPDDDLIGCGGSIAKHIGQGDLVTVVYMTSGEAGSLHYSKSDLARIREAEAAKAAAVLGLTDLIFFQRPDGYLNYNRENLIPIINLIREKQPNLVYLPHKNDLHKDHIRTYELVMEACTRASGPWFPECEGQPWSVDIILGYEVWTPLSEVSYIEDITSFMDLKVEALKQHKSQIQDIRYDEAIRGLNRYRGIMSGKGEYCECFQVIKINQFFHLEGRDDHNT